jgi:hypothetical protein
MGGGDKQEHWLTEGFGPADLREAKALLEEVFWNQKHTGQHPPGSDSQYVEGFVQSIEVFRRSSMAATTQILEKLQLLQALVQSEGVRDDVTEATISKLLSYQLEKLRDRQRQIREKLTAFEERYNLKTDEFSRRFRDGRMGDEMDFFEWSALADIYQELSQRLTEAERVTHGSSDPGTPQWSQDTGPFPPHCTWCAHPRWGEHGNQRVPEDAVGSPIEGCGW